MELELKQNHFSYYETLVDVTLSREETLESIVPDACMDIQKVVTTEGTVFLSRREIRGNRAELGGTVRATVLYQPEDDTGLRHLEVAIPFACGADLLNPPAGCKLVAVPRIEGCETRSLNPRKVLVRAAVSVQLRVYAPQTGTLCSGVSEDCCSRWSVEQRCEEYATYLIKSVQEKPFTFSDELSLAGSKPPMEELLRRRVEILAVEGKLIGSKLVVKGMASLQLLYRTMEGSLNTADFELPFSQIVEMSDMVEEGDPEVAVQVTGLECSPLGGGDGRELSVTLQLLAQAVGRGEERFSALTDLYSIRHPLKSTWSGWDVSEHLGSGVGREQVRGLMETERAVNTVIDLSAGVEKVAQTREGEEVLLHAELWATVLYLDENGIPGAVTRRMPSVHKLSLPANGTCAFSCRVGQERTASPVTDGVEVRLIGEFHYQSLLSDRIQAVDQATLEETAYSEGDAPSLVLRRMGAEESLWAVAKSCRTTVGDIVQANELLSEEPDEGRLLLIPQKR